MELQPQEQIVYLTPREMWHFAYQMHRSGFGHEIVGSGIDIEHIFVDDNGYGASIFFNGLLYQGTFDAAVMPFAYQSVQR